MSDISNNIIAEQRGDLPVAVPHISFEDNLTHSIIISDIFGDSDSFGPDMGERYSKGEKGIEEGEEEALGGKVFEKDSEDYGEDDHLEPTFCSLMVQSSPADCDHWSSSMASIDIPFESSVLLKARRNSHNSVCNSPPPLVPKSLLPTHCQLSSLIDVSEVKSRIDHFLSHYNGISFHFSEIDHLWDALYVKGSQYCNVVIRLYSSGYVSPQAGLIVEVQRMEGDGFAFTRLFSDLKDCLLSNEASEANDCKTNDVDGLQQIDDSGAFSAEINSFLRSMIGMLRDRSFESKLEGCRLLCDFASSEALRPVLCEFGCIESLLDIITSNSSPFSMLRTHAIMALSLLSDLDICKEKLFENEAAGVHALLTIASDGPYHTSQLRNESFEILANLAKTHGDDLVAAVGKMNLNAWLLRRNEAKDLAISRHSCTMQALLVL